MTPPTTTTGGNNNENNDEVMMDLDIHLLIKLVPEFDGTFANLTQFLANVDNAFRLAKAPQIPVLLTFVKAALKGPAQNIVHTTSHPTWESLRKKLLTIYGEKKSFAQIQIELQNLKQLRDESVASFTSKIENKIQKLMSALSFENNGIVQQAQQDLIKKMGLTTFIHNSLPQYGQLLRIRNPSSITEASRLASDEEIALKFQKMSVGHTTSFKPNFNGNSSFNRNFNPNKKVFATEKLKCSYCHKDGHKIDNCFKKNKSKMICNFCKKEGHLENRCFAKRNAQIAKTDVQTNPKNGSGTSQNGLSPPKTHAQVNVIVTEELKMRKF